MFRKYKWTEYYELCQCAAIYTEVLIHYDLISDFSAEVGSSHRTSLRSDRAAFSSLRVFEGFCVTILLFKKDPWDLKMVQKDASGNSTQSVIKISA